MTDYFSLIKEFRSFPCVSGFEDFCGKCNLSGILPDAQNWEEDESGNLFYLKKGHDSSKTILLEAHRDTIGLCVKEYLCDSFYSVSACGGFDAAILPGTLLEIITRNGKRVPAIAATKPPHVLTEEDRKKKPSISDIYVDTGVYHEQVMVGDPVFFSASTEKMANGRIVSQGLDNAVGVAALIALLDQMHKPRHDVLFLLSASEETNSKGVTSFLRDRKIHCALILDAGFHLDRGLDETKCIVMGKGPSVSVTDTLSPAMTQFVVNTASKLDLPLQIICEPGGTGTSATQVQLRDNGIPSAVISIPICNMHTPSEIVKISDLEDTVNLLQAFCEEEKLPAKEVVFNEC